MGGPSLTLTGDASPLREMTKKVRRALGKADTQELLATIGSEIVATTNRRFEAGKDPNGGKWPVSLGAREENRKTLIKTGRLRIGIRPIPTPERFPRRGTIRSRSSCGSGSSSKPCRTKPAHRISTPTTSSP